MRKVIVFSAINVTQGGPLTIMHTFAQYATANLLTKFDVYFLVKDRKILAQYPVKTIEFPNSQKTFLHKLYYEYFGFKTLSNQLKPYLWFSLNDCSPTVSSEIQVVYFHNATPFYEVTWLDIRFPSRVLIQKFYYNLFYRLNLFRNRYVVVQQQFLKNYVHRNLGFSSDKVLIHRPEMPQSQSLLGHILPKKTGIIFFYPTKTFVYKNIHVIIKALDYLKKKNKNDVKIMITIDGSESRYGRWLKRLASKHSEISFTGYLDYKRLTENYINCDCLLFPSKLETWGLPLSEARHFNKFILAADLPYAHETLDNYPNVLYFNPNSAEMLADKMEEYINLFHNKLKATENYTANHSNFDARTMDSLFQTILSGL
jgi:glycosyltransferase involved in cell wall biosynthesis